MKKSLIMIVLLLAGVPALLAQQAGDTGKTGKKYLLNYGPQKGDRYAVSASILTNSLQEMQGKSNEVVKSGNLEGELTVKDTGKEGALLELRYDKRTGKTESRGRDIPEDYMGFFGKTVSFRLSTEGTAGRFSGFDALPNVQLANRSVKTADNHTFEIAELFFPLPGKKVAAGEEWTQTVKVKRPTQAGYSTEITRVYTAQITGEKQNNGLHCAVIAFSYTETEEGRASRGPGLDLTIKFTGKGKGTAYFAYEKGVVAVFSTDLKREGEVNLEAQGMTISVSEDITAAVSLQEK